MHEYDEKDPQNVNDDNGEEVEEPDFEVKGSISPRANRMFEVDPEWEVDPDEAEAQALQDLSTVEGRARQQVITALLTAQTRVQRLRWEVRDRYDASRPDVEKALHSNLTRAPLEGLRTAFEVALQCERGNYRDAILEAAGILRGILATVRENTARLGQRDLVASHLGEDAPLPVGTLNRHLVFTWAAGEAHRIRTRANHVYELLPETDLWDRAERGSIHRELVRLEWMERGLAALTDEHDHQQLEQHLRDLITTAIQAPMQDNSSNPGSAN